MRGAYTAIAVGAFLAMATPGWAQTGGARISRGDDGAKDEWAKLGGTWEAVDDNMNGQSRDVAWLGRGASIWKP